MDLGTRWLAFGLQAHPQYATKWTVEHFGFAIDEVIRLTPISEEKLEAVFDFVQKDDFWQKQARSPAGLLKKSERNGLRKIDNILSRLPTKKADMWASVEEKFYERYPEHRPQDVTPIRKVVT